MAILRLKNYLSSIGTYLEPLKKNFDPQIVFDFFPLFKMAILEYKNEHFEEIRAWLEILEWRCNSTIFCLTFDTHDSLVPFSYGNGKFIDLISLNPTIINITRRVDWLMGQRTHQPGVWCSKHWFFFITSYRVSLSFLISWLLCRFCWLYEYGHL